MYCFLWFFCLIFFLEDQLPKYMFILIAALSGLFVFLMYRNLVLIKWRIWAFENVRNVHELKQKAIDNGIISKDGAWIEKYEIRSYEQIQKLKELEKKFQEKDVYTDDLSVTKETKIYYSKKKLILRLLFWMSLVGFFIYLSSSTSDYDFKFLIILIAGIFIVSKDVIKLLNRKPQIIINDRGIELQNDGLVIWKNVLNAKVYVGGRGKYGTAKNYLALNDNQVLINDLSIKFEELENLLHVYRVRYEKNNL